MWCWSLNSEWHCVEAKEDCQGHDTTTTPPFNIDVFLAVQNSSIGDLVTDSLTEGTFTFEIQRATLEACNL